MHLSYHIAVNLAVSVGRCRPSSVNDRLYSRHRADTWGRKMNQTKKTYHIISYKPLKAGQSEFCCTDLRHCENCNIRSRAGSVSVSVYRLSDSALIRSRFGFDAESSLRELANCSAVRMFDLQDCRKDLAWRTSSYLTALHLGSRLKDRCATTDPERAVLSEMLQGLKSRWKAVWQLIVRRYCMLYVFYIHYTETKHLEAVHSPMYFSLQYSSVIMISLCVVYSTADVRMTLYFRENYVHKTLVSMGLVNDSLKTVYECLIITKVYIGDAVKLNGDLQTVRGLVNETNVRDLINLSV